jgi:predicted deacetylase
MVFIMKIEMANLMIFSIKEKHLLNRRYVPILIFQEIGIKISVFIPPAWKLNDSSIKVLEKVMPKKLEQFLPLY